MAVTGVSLNKTSTSLTVGKSETLTIAITPTNATNKTVTWTSSDTSVATVSSTGVVTAKKAGTATITVKTSNGKTASCKVTVPVPIIEVTNITLNKTSTTLAIGNSETLTIAITPTNATNKTVTWTSSDTSVATVSSTGVVTAKKAGTATITVKTSNGKTASCKVTVPVPIIEVTNITLNKTSTTLAIGNSETLTIAITPTNATNQTVTWTSSDTSVATVSSTGVVTANKAGTATITVKTSNGKTTSCKVTVPVPIIEVTNITLNKTSTTLAIGNSETLTIAITPTNATNQTVTWTSSDTSVATVSSTGVVTANKAGTATITVKTSNGKTASCKVTIYSAPITTSNMLAGFSLVASYDSSTLKYWVESGGNKSAYGSNNMKIAHIWVKDPYNQMKIALAPKGFNSVDYGGNILKAEVDNKGYSSKGLIATNSGFFSQSSKTSSNPWGYSVQIPYVLNNGNVMRDDTGTDLTTSLIYWTWGMNKDGQLVTYGTNKSSANNTNIKNNIQNAGLKFTSSFSGTLVARNGEASTPGTDSATRTAICQIDSNNFILMTATNASFNNLTNFLKNYENCQFAINLDGGGSSTMYYKTNTNTVQNIYNNNNRKLADMVYFVEA